MKKILLFSVVTLMCNIIRAQPWIPPVGGAPVKFSDVVKAYHRQLNNNIYAGSGLNGIAGKTKNDLFEQWAWYWGQHLDENGYIVPPLNTLLAWQKYAAQVNRNKKTTRTTSLSADWEFVGPNYSAGGYSGLGRINVVAFDPTDSNTIYVGSAAGGTWKTTNGGATWESLYDFLPTLGVADIKVNPLNPNTVYVATGDGDGNDAYSSGVIVSNDGGATWVTTGLDWLPTAYDNARSLLINPLDTASLMLGTNIGIFKSYNAGVTWTDVAPGNFKQILYNPVDTSIVYGTVYTDTSAQIMLSTNGGVTWAAVTSFTDAQRISLAVCPASPTVVMAVASDTSTSGLKGIYSSTNSGESYAAVYTEDASCTRELLGYDVGLPTGDCGGQGWYALCIAMNPTNASEVTVGGINTYYSADGGSTWTIANQWYSWLPGVSVVHANKHCLAYNPLSGALFEACDGGIYKNYGLPTSSWTDLSNGLCITEFYKNAVNNDVSFCIGGCQNDGTKLLNGTAATDLSGGNGMLPVINYGNPANIFYCSSQYGYITMTRNAGVDFNPITDVLGSSGGWLTPYALHPTDTATLLLGYQNVFVSYNNGVSWAAISPVFDSGSNLTQLAIAYTNPNYIYTAQDDTLLSRSIIHYTTNFGVTWDSIHVPFTNFISDLVIDPKNENNIWVTVSGYSAADKVYNYNLTTNTWTNYAGSLPDLPVDCMLIDTSSQTQYIGTDAAVFYKDTTMTDWALYNTNLPTVHVYGLNINYTTGEIWGATFGRGMWKSIKAANPGTLSVKQVSATAITVAPNPCHGSFVINTSSPELLGGAITANLLTADGRTVMNIESVFDNNGNLKINTSGLPAGFYICEVSRGNIIERAKVLIY